MPPCLGTCCCLGCPLPPLARLLWTFSETSSEVTFSVKLPPACLGEMECFFLLSLTAQPRDCGCGYQAMLLCHVAMSWTSIHSLMYVSVGEKTGTFPERSLDISDKMLKSIHCLSPMSRKLSDSFIQDTFIEY